MDDNGVDARMDGGNDQPLPVQPAEAPTSYIGNTETDNFTDTSWNRAGTDIPTEVSLTVLSAPDSMESHGAIAIPQPAPVGGGGGLGQGVGGRRQVQTLEG